VSRLRDRRIERLRRKGFRVLKKAWELAGRPATDTEHCWCGRRINHSHRRKAVA
jgi:hypothetical protein